MGTIYKRDDSPVYYGCWTDLEGRSRRKSLRTRDAKVAAARLRELELGSTNPATYSRHPLSHAVTHLLEAVDQTNADATHDFYERKAGHLLRILGVDTHLGDLTRDQVLAYVRQRKLETASGSTIHKELVTLRRVLHEAFERKLWDGDVDAIVPKVKVDYVPKKTWLDEHQLNQLLARIAADRRLWVMIAAFGGLCLGEIERLDWQHVDLKNNVLHVPGTKRASRLRTVPIGESLRTALAAARGERTAGPVVEPWSNVRRALSQAAVLAKLPDHLRKLSPNDLRRTFASLMLNKGVPTLVVAKLLGHSSTKMVELVYGQISARSFAGAVAQLPVSDHWETGGRNAGASVDTPETSETPSAKQSSSKIAKRKAVLVPRDGVEPPTRGFSVPCSTN